MSEIEAAAADGAGALFRRKPKHALPVGTPCPNCATALEGPWCHACGQSAEDYHRSLARLAGEAFEGLFELDGRLWRTLPNLIFNPARLTRDYLDGHRVPQAPPFRSFLIAVVLVFLAGSIGGNKTHNDVKLGEHAAAATGKGPSTKLNFGDPTSDRIGKWVTTRGQNAMNHPDEFKTVLVTWAQRLSILALPLSAMLLGMMFFWRRGIYMFDHLIFSMHSLSFQGLLVTTIMLGEQLSGAFTVLILLSPVHLFCHLKGTYGLGVFGTLVRMVLLLIGSSIAFGLLMLGLVLIGLYEIGG